jgi:hypothetical protein
VPSSRALGEGRWENGNWHPGCPRAYKPLGPDKVPFCALLWPSCSTLSSSFSLGGKPEREPGCSRQSGYCPLQPRQLLNHPSVQGIRQSPWVHICRALPSWVSWHGLQKVLGLVRTWPRGASP